MEDQLVDLLDFHFGSVHQFHHGVAIDYSGWPFTSGTYFVMTLLHSSYSMCLRGCSGNEPEPNYLEVMFEDYEHVSNW